MWSISCLQNKDNRSLNEKLSSLENTYTTESERLRGELSRLRGVEEEAKNKSNQVSTLQEELERLRKELSSTQQEKKTIEDWAQTYRDEMEKVSQKPRFIWNPGTSCLQTTVQSVSYLHIPGSSFSGQKYPYLHQSKVRTHFIYCFFSLFLCHCWGSNL